MMLISLTGFGQLNLPVNFEPGLDYQLTDFGGNASQLVADPTDGSNTVVQSTKPNNAELWAGTTVGGSAGFATPIPFTANSTSMSVRVWSPTAGTPIRLKVENSGNDQISVETEATTTMAGMWETLIFNFSNQAAGTAALNLANSYNKASMFFNFGTDGATAGEQTYYWDDMEFIEGMGSTQIDLPVNFEDSEADYALIDFGGNASSIVADPTDGSNTVVQSIKTGSAELWAGTTVGGTMGFANPIPFTADATTMTVRVWSPTAGTPIRLKVENSGNDQISVETEATTTMAGMWETLTFDFSNPASGTAALNLANSYNKASMFFNFGTTGAEAGEQTYYWDDMEFASTGGGNNSEYCSTPVQHLGIPAETASAILLTITNVDENSMFIEIESADSDPVDFLLIVGGSGATISDENTSEPGKISRTMTWDTPPAEVVMNILWSKASFGGNWQLSPADITVPFAAACGEDPLDQVSLPVTFEDENVDYGLTDFGGNASSIVTDPTDASNTVAQTIKTGAAELWAGTTLGGAIGFAGPVPFMPGSTVMTVRVWSPTAGTPIRLKVENSTNGDISVETEATTTMAGMWETLTFDFTNPAAGTQAINFSNVYQKASIFFNFGTTGGEAGEQTYYWDDVEFVPGVAPDPIELPVTFEEEINYDLVDFGGNASMIVTDPTDANNTVAQTIKTGAAELWAGTTIGGAIGFSSPVPFVPGSTVMTVRVWSPTAGTPIRLKVENSTNGDISVETEATTTMAGVWETLTFDFTNPAAGTQAINFSNVYQKASIFFNFGTTGGEAGEQTYYWDDVEFVPGEAPDPIELPVTFEEEIDYALLDFGGNASMIVTDPTDANNTVAQSIKTGAAELWAGTTIGGVIGFASPIPFADGETIMSLRVWSPTANTPIRLKVENAGNNQISVETEATTTVAGMWETLIFDFANEATGTAPINLSNVYNKASVFFNFGTTGAEAGEQTYYWDDLYFGTPVTTNSVFDIIAGSEVHTTLETAIILAGLEETLTNDGPFTVFAPTDAAFAAVDPDLLADLIADPTGDLTEVLLYHVLSGTILSNQLSDGQQAPTLQGESITVGVNGGVVTIDMATVIVADLEADNGVVHVIDAVLLPSTIVGIQEATAAGIFEVGPNPSNDIFNLRFRTEPGAGAEWSLFDSNGKQIMRERIQSSNLQIATAGLSSGIYLLRVDHEGMSYFTKLMIAR
jgi:uncharacterized surface protein with fasciclin (FAS1) repeats/ribosomal protein L28